MLITVHFWLPMIEQIMDSSFSISINSRVFENVVPVYFLFFDLPYSSLEYYPAGIGLVYYVCLFKFKKLFRQNRFVFIIMLFGLFSVVVASISLFWRIDLFYKIFSVIQFPWRFYMFATLFFIIGFSLSMKDVKLDNFLKICFIYLFIIYIANVCLYSYNVYLKEPLSDEIMMGEYLPKDFGFDIIDNYKNKNINYKRNKDFLEISIVKNVENIELPLIYYKGYKACGENNCYDIYKTDNGLVGVKINGTDNLKVWYSGTKIYNITKYISVLGVLVLIYKIKKSH